MAIFIPSIPQDFNSSIGEMKVYDSLRMLDNNYVVFHSLSWIGIGDRTLGEADFVVMHPNKGILVVEVKSGEIEYKNGEWLQTNSKSKVTKRINPFIQARRSQFEILDRLQASTKCFHLPMACYCVWFPSISTPRKESLPPEAPIELVLDEKSLDNPKKAIDKAFEFWTKKTRIVTNLDSHQYKEIINILCPHFHAVPRLKTTVDEAEQYYIQLTNQQVALLNFLYEQDTAVIHGLAGTGKTVLAIEKAKDLAAQGKTVLFLCYNSFLRDYLRENNNMPNVEFHNAHSLAYAMLDDKNTPLEELLIEFEDYLETVYQPEDWLYMNVIIDEGQDLDDRLINRLYELVKAKKGCFYVFYDRNQYIMRNDVPKWIENSECRLVLHKNCRNTAEVFKTSCSILGIEDFSHSNDIHGETPNVSFYNNMTELSEIVEKFIKLVFDGGLSKKDIVMLTATSMENTWLDINKEFAGCSLSQAPQEDSIFFTTIRKFKGLEAKAILLVDVSMRGLADPEIRRLIYVGSSRAKFLLQMAILDDVEMNNIGDCLRKINPSRNVPKNKKGFGRLINAKLNGAKV